MTDKPAAPKQRVSDEKITQMLAQHHSHGHRSRRHNCKWCQSLWDLQDARAALARCTDYAATLGIENDELRRITGEMRDNEARDMKAYNALRDAVKDASKLPTPTDRDCKLPEIAVGLFEKELAESGDAPECTCVVNAEPNPWCPKCTDTGNQPAVQILVRGGKPYRVCDTWIAVEAFETIPKDSHEGRWWNRADKCICPDYAYHLITPFTKDHPLWLAWRAFNCPTTTHTTTDAPEIHTSFIPDGLYSVVECEACEGLGNETYKDETETEFAVLASHSRPTCGGTGKTLKRTEDQHE